ncbi:MULTISPECIES: ammonium transporter [unclassified Pseudoalteromonas]|uniref:ammonium transporter n=1 Tax=unclassified Pseudoalteromonas TaxID=194690 RepID=UPI0006941F04|nr:MULTISPECIES: ammonium transporter [unclassified Pseudoalteromonas]
MQENYLSVLSEPVNLMWVLISTALVLLMQVGFCFLEVGAVRSKNSINVAVKNISDFCVANVIFLIFGFAIMFSNNTAIFNTDYLMLHNVDSTALFCFFVFQAMFCGTASTILSGSISERATFFGYLILAIFVSAIIYPVFGRMAWGGAIESEKTGWLNQQGFVDFAGSSVVHSVGGWVALAAIIIIGPRIGRFTKGIQKIQGHNIPMSTTGTIFLWFGWIGFNAGSTLAINDSVPKIILNTNTAAAFGGLTTLILTWMLMKKPNVPHILNGVLAGLVSITASCHAVEVYEAAAIGVLGAIIYLYSSHLLDKFEIDDVVGAVPVHGFCGLWGTLAVALFGSNQALGTGLNFGQQLFIQLIGGTVCFVLAFGGTYIFLLFINKLIALRVSKEHEINGLNVSEHDASTEILDLLYCMETQKTNGDFSEQVYVEPHTEVGQIAAEYNRVLDKVNEEMNISIEARKLVELEHKRTTDSINYSSLIQHAIIPNDTLFKHFFSDHFTYWKPRDVIGGDIYLFDVFKKRNECLLMVIDCTGHGVPGAFVTMLVKAIERQVIGKINGNNDIDISPAWILAYFNKAIKTLLHQEGKQSKCNAGFDGGIILYNKNTNTVKYAGAQLPLFMIQEGEIELIKGDKHSVGYRSCDFDFVYKDHEIIIDKETYIYLTTDGYIDQIGGDKNFPYGKNRFKKTLLEVHHKNMIKQKQTLIKNIHEYQKQEETTDDITVIGIKISNINC